jgi:uncharacterized membrane protein (UPF0136 family)
LIEPQAAARLRCRSPRCPQSVITTASGIIGNQRNTSSVSQGSGVVVSNDAANGRPPAASKRRWDVLAWSTSLVALLLSLGAATSVCDWPAIRDPVPAEIQSAVGDRTDLVGRADVYNFWDNFIDSQHLWRVEMAPEVAESLVSQWNLRELASADNVPRAFWRWMPCWWRPPQSGPARYFMSSGFEPDGRGSDGSHFLIAYDVPRRILYVWHKNNF